MKIGKYNPGQKFDEKNMYVEKRSTEKNKVHKAKGDRIGTNPESFANDSVQLINSASP